MNIHKHIEFHASVWKIFFACTVMVLWCGGTLYKKIYKTVRSYAIRFTSPFVVGSYIINI